MLFCLLKLGKRKTALNFLNPGGGFLRIFFKNPGVPPFRTWQEKSSPDEGILVRIPNLKLDKKLIIVWFKPNNLT